MSKHTPGLLQAIEELIDQVMQRTEPCDEVSEAMENVRAAIPGSRLIAAAPDLLEAAELGVQMVLVAAYMAETGEEPTDQVIRKMVDMCEPDSPLGKILAVCKKARGES